MLVRIIRNNQLSKLNRINFRFYSDKVEVKTYPASSCAEGTKLKGINYLKTQQDPIAKADTEYPSWLWTLLEPKEATDVLSRDFQRNANKKRIKGSNFLKQK
ncbi:hypothetical protein CONCODRAFT_103362 [Conidiobolus coronatus NRRL 28638]|uniref:Large ribosomal subunit protein mL54 n=1 Tax=Conidiobolus coronatus (strain ATCC 28846 / CBS 209.66 / NRRL 28638) TaxID=796925 RepID=A0A137P113_CONC2|nr:hypothetical protein CONCODRAFT_103362 [Conidiobolus coronatus NRRL 28638]|eukprot:KXN68756.1 hypothetical protein CONCODRAFT_103362 [Conidiobolus coronatus NRRL 28638]